MQLNKRLAASTILVVAIIIVALAAGAGIYVMSTNMKGSGTTPTSSSPASTTPTSTFQTTPSSATQTTPTSTTQAMPSTTATVPPTTVTTVSTTSVPVTTPQTITTSSVTNTCWGTTTQSESESIQAYMPLLEAASSMTSDFYEINPGGPTLNITQAYTVESTEVVSGVTVYKVEFTENATNEGTPYSVSATGWVDSNGNVLAFYFEGQNITGPQAESDFFTFSSAFYVQAIFTSEFQFFLNAAGVTSSTTSVTLGPTTMQVTDYQASSLPLTISACGYSFTLTSFSLEAGTIPGSSVNVVVYLNMAGTQTSSSSNVSVDMVVKVTSLTKA